VTDVAGTLDRVGPEASGSSVLPPDRPGSPGSLIVSFAGSYLRQLGGWIAVADLVRLLGTVGVPAASVRQALVRLKSRGFLTAARRGSAAGYELTTAGLHDLETGDRRIFRYGGGESDGWVLAVFSVPESDRAVRHRLRTELSWLGFGTVSPGVWIAPTGLSGPAAELLRDADLDGYVNWFTGASATAERVAQWWDLDALDADYRRFLADHRALLDRSTVDDENAFRRYVLLVDAWRRFPRLDPGLPARLLPADWPARAAWDTFSTLHGRWHHRGLTYVGSIVAARAANRAVG
jgi:phenylacetic acid degradation operon negative regulatory protein